jgi:hypothetical protein
MEKISQASATILGLAKKQVNVQTGCRQFLAFVPLAKMDPGLVYLSWLISIGGKIADWALIYAQSLRQEPLSASQFLEHHQRLQHLNLLEKSRGSFDHCVIEESRDDACTALVNAALTHNDSPQNTIGEVGSESSCPAISLCKLGADNKVDDETQKRLDEDEWMLVFSMEPAPEVTEEALAEAEIFTGGMGLAM